MFDENQLVEVKWSNKMRKWYESQGYTFTAYGDEFFVRAKDLSKGSKQRIKLNCDYCGKEYSSTYDDYNRRMDKSRDVCSDRCRALVQYENSREERAKYQFDKVRTVCDMYGYKLLTTEEEYTTIYMDIRFICPKHGLRTTTLYNLVHGHKCICCSYEERGVGLRHSIEYVKSIIESFNNNKLLNPDDYIGANVHNLRIECGICGKEYITSFSDYVIGKQIRCKPCAQSESVGEMRIREFLEINKISFVQEKRFEDCKDKRILPFDFYLPSYNLCIEFDGQHHFQENHFKNYKSTKKHDEIKNQYCKDNDIDLLRIPYWEGNKIEDIIAKQLNL